MHKQLGFTLLELLATLIIGMVVITGIINVTLLFKKTSEDVHNQLIIQQNFIFASNMIEQGSRLPNTTITVFKNGQIPAQYPIKPDKNTDILLISTPDLKTIRLYFIYKKSLYEYTERRRKQLVIPDVSNLQLERLYGGGIIWLQFTLDPGGTTVGYAVENKGSGGWDQGPKK